MAIELNGTWYKKKAGTEAPALLSAELKPRSYFVLPTSYFFPWSCATITLVVAVPTFPLLSSTDTTTV